jgi:hypothetical protein
MGDAGGSTNNVATFGIDGPGSQFYVLAVLGFDKVDASCFAFFLAFFHLVAIAFCAISLRRSGVRLAARLLAIATALGSFWVSFISSILPQEQLV